VDYLCRRSGGEIAAASDVEAVALADLADLSEYALTDAVREVIARAVRMQVG
jgi:hypothetical protein